MEDSRNKVETEMNGTPMAGNDAGAGMAAPETAGGAQITEIVGAVPGASVGGMPVNGVQTEILGAPEAPEAAGGVQITAAAGAAPVNIAQPGAVPETVAAAGTQAPESAKKRGAGKKFLGVVELLAAAALLVLAGWMFYNTRGTRLLYVDVDFGRMCKYYWAPAAGALVLFAVGLYTLKRAGREVKKDGKLE